MKYRILFLLFLLSSPSFLVAQSSKITLAGYIKEKGSGENLIGAVVAVPSLKMGVAANAYGFFSISLPSGTDSVELIISMIGYSTIKQRILPDKNQSINFSLPSSTLLKEVQVDADAIKEAQETRMSSIDLSAEEIRNIPALMGEKDVIKALQLLPGVQKGGEGSAGLYVRGGGPDQNLLILDDAPVYNANHLFGFFSTFNGDAIKNVELVKGGFPARYGGRLSSVVDISMKDGNKEGYHGEVGIGTIASRAVIEGPIQKGKSSFVLSGRRTYIDALIALMLPKELSAGYYFYDLNAKLNFELSAKDRLYFSGYFGKDKFYQSYTKDTTNSKAQLYWGNATGTARWNHRFNDKLFSNLSFITTDYTFGIESEQKYGKQVNSLGYLSQIRDFTLKNDLDWYFSSRHQFKTGLMATSHLFTPQAVALKGSIGNLNINTKNEYYSIETGIYLEDNVKLTDRLAANIGLRLSSFYVQNKFYFRPEPRISARYLLNETLSVKASYAEMNQYLHLLSNSLPGLPTDLWVPATKKVVPEYSRQVAAGITKDYPQKGFTMSLETYYKQMNNIIAYKEGASFLSAEVSNNNEIQLESFEDKVTQGIGRSYGAEFFLKYNKKKLNGWIGYTLSWTKQQFDSINFGKAFYAKYDRRHDISVVVSYQITPRRRLSLTWVYGSGNAITLPEGSISINQFDVSANSFGYQPTATLYGERNGFRMRAYHRLDIGLQTTKKKGSRTRITELSIYNAYSRANPYFYYIGQDELSNKPVLKQISLFPFLPSISYAVKF